MKEAFYLKVDKAEGNLLTWPFNLTSLWGGSQLRLLCWKFYLAFIMIILNGLPGGPCPPVNRRD